MVVRDGSQMGVRIMNLTNSEIVYRERFVEIRNLQFICANGARISDLCESHTVYSRHNESNKPNLKSLAHIGSEKSLVELGVSKNELFDFFHIFHSTENFTFSP